MKKNEKPDNYYVDNDKFYEAMVEWKKQVNEADELGVDRPPVSSYIAECFFKIAEGIATKRQYRNYNTIEDMKMDAVENCIRYAHNFDPEKSTSPFAYFTRFTYFAFHRHISKEKKNLYKTYKATEHANIFDITSDKQGHDNNVYDDTIKMSEGAEQYKDEFIENYEKNLEEKAIKNRKKELDNIIGDDDESARIDDALWEEVTHHGEGEY